VTDRGRATTLFVVAAAVVATGAFAVGQATGSDDPQAPEVQPLETEASSSSGPRLAKVPAVPPLQAEPQEQSSSATPEAAAPEAEAPAAEAPAAEAPAPQAPVTPEQPAQQPETPAVGE
jgi:hypothetical protein